MCLKLDKLLSPLIETAKSMLKVDRVLIYRFNEDYSGYVYMDTKGDEMELGKEAAWDEESRVRIYKPNEFYIKDSYLKTHQIYHYKGSQSISICSDIERENLSSCFKDLMRRLGGKAYGNVPIFEEENLWGLLGVYEGKIREWKTSDIEYLLELGYIISTFINYERVLKQAKEDTLTGLANRYKIEKYLKEKNERKEDYCLLYIDCDEFKQVNDYYGHGIGDEVLKYIAGVIKGKLKEDEIAARMGGDEFLIVSSVERAQVLAMEIVKELNNKPFNLEGMSSKIKCGVSIGVLNEGGDYKEDLVRVDKLMYKAKQQGGSRVYTDRPVYPYSKYIN